MSRFFFAVIEYLLGFLALAFFAFLAFGSAPTNDDRLLFAFKAAAPLAAAEIAVLLRRGAPANRLIVGANLWLAAGGLAAFTEQWWWLKGYQQIGEASLFVAMAVVGVLTTAMSAAWFVGVVGPRRNVVLASLGLLAAVGFAVLAAIHYRGDVKLAAVLPVIALSWINRLLRLTVAHAA